jgi:translation initiation factor 1
MSWCDATVEFTGRLGATLSRWRWLAVLLAGRGIAACYGDRFSVDVGFFESGYSQQWVNRAGATMRPMKNKMPASALVYSTEAGRMCPACRQPVVACVCKANARLAAPVGDGVVRVSRDTKGRGGKAVTLVKGVSLPEAGLIALGKSLKAACGSGGTVKEGVIEIQGDHVERVMAALLAQGHRVKRAGG